jgi:hypothetical protein
LRGYAGIEEVDYDYNTGSLKAVYDPRLLSNESALQIIQKAGAGHLHPCGAMRLQM